MPFRSPKMYSFIFGFQRFVWWPKCTPASSRSLTAIGVKRPPARLPFAELEALARASQPILLTFFDARVARQQPRPLQRRAQFQAVMTERARNAEPQRPGLSGDPAAG